LGFIAFYSTYKDLKIKKLSIATRQAQSFRQIYCVLTKGKPNLFYELCDRDWMVSDPKAMQ